MLSDYTFSPALRYEAHALILTTPAEPEPIRFEGVFGAALLSALLVGTEEGSRRGIAIESDAERLDWIARYEREVLRDDWGLLRVELELLNDAYIELNTSEVSFDDLCPKVRLRDLAFGLIDTYMKYLVKEEFGEHIWDYERFSEPFIGWLFGAGYTETRRQRFLKMNWFDAEAVIALANDELAQNEPYYEPTFVFEGDSAKRVIETYFQWRMDKIQKRAEQYPDAAVQLAQMKADCLRSETDFSPLKEEIDCMSSAQQNAFRKWLTEWRAFILAHMVDPTSSTKRLDRRQEFFLDEFIPAPKPNSYAEVRNYIQERSKYDKNFKNFVRTRKRTDLCDQLTYLFGWVVSPNSLGKSMNRKRKR